MIDEAGIDCRLEIDGGVKVDNIKQVAEAGETRNIHPAPSRIKNIPILTRRFAPRASLLVHRGRHDGRWIGHLEGT